MTIMAVIPARGGSKGVPRKNIKHLGGKPLIKYSIDSAIDCGKFACIVVSTDDAEIAKISNSDKVDVPGLRPKYLASDSSPTIDTIIYTIGIYEKLGKAFDAVCILQPTCPFRQVRDMQRAIEKFELCGADSLITVSPVPSEFNPHWVFKLDETGNYLKIATGDKEIITRRQLLPKAYYRNGSMYLVKTDTLVTKRSLYGESVAFYEDNHNLHVNIDTMDDWQKAEAIISNWPHN